MLLLAPWVHQTTINYFSFFLKGLITFDNIVSCLALLVTLTLNSALSCVCISPRAGHSLLTEFLLINHQEDSSLADFDCLHWTKHSQHDTVPPPGLHTATKWSHFARPCERVRTPPVKTNVCERGMSLGVIGQPHSSVFSVATISVN